MKKERKEQTLFDYINWRGDLDYSKEKINKLDLLLFAMISLLDLDNIIKEEPITLKELCDNVFKGKKAKDLDLGLIIPKTIFLMLKEMSEASRYKDILLSDYINDISIEDNEQTSALCVHIDNNLIVCFSGTDDTIIGWKENFMMIYDKTLSAEEKSVDYLTFVSNKYSDKNIYVCGHSKGGHLAVFSSINVIKEIQDRIINVYSFDGPGQNEKEILKINNNNMINKITTVMPQASTVGRLFNHIEPIEIIYSTQTAFFQHDPYSWQVERNDFIHTDEIDQDSINLNNKINEVLQGMEYEERKELVEGLYELLSSNGNSNLTSVYKKRNSLFNAYFKLSKKKRDSIFKPFMKLLKDKSAQKTIFDSIRVYVIESKRTHQFDKDLDNKLLQ